MATVLLALGTNLGERLSNLRAALEAFAPEIHVLAESAVYETEPWGYADQPAFLNMVVRAQTELTPPELLDRLKNLEATLGRTPTFRNGPRLIDLDILFYDDLLLDTPSLVIPHPRLHERAFVLVPLAEVAPTLMHPRLGQSVAQLLATVDRRGVVKFKPTG
jgi:2-amino-4-hydroxy-6-hydroxymethyldihydropteridine diphosphokinase